MALTQVSRGLLSTSIVDNGNATAITIDSSENVLVGMDSASTTVDGLYLRPGTNSGINASNSHALTLNRRTNDGTIVKFDKDGLPVGLISTVAGRLGIGTGDAGLFFDDDNNRIGPVTLATGTPVDSNGLLDLGYSGARYKDLYLSGGAYLGGTAAANKLDDYEEGTFTPTLTDTSSGISPTYISSARVGNYTKVGNVVNFILEIRTSTVSGGSSAELRITGLPFSVKTGTEPSFALSMYNIAFHIDYIYVVETISGQLYVRASRNATTSVNMPSSAWSSNNPTLIRITGTYQTT